jgi:type III pantothenate kinase
VIIVDFGTATTFDCVNAGGEYVGGAIAPGFRISEEALFTHTAQLPRVEVARPPAVIGRNTVHAIQSGLFYGYVGLVDALAQRCRAELDPEARVVATGGYASLVATESACIDEVDPWLTLRGLALLYRRNQR